MSANAVNPDEATRRAILGTAGHIDHGKSSLVKALTGTDPDRLPEEQARGMTIELGFARLDLPGARLGIVDVPGHERFVRTMVAGATGIDLALLVVAADDGVMPQTREHVEILDLLGVTRGLVAISKADLVDADRVAAVGAQVRAAAAGTPLAEWDHVAVSAVRGDGLDELKRRLTEIAAALPEERTSTIFRMALDRVFAVRGRGTVVTGSVLRGSVETGQTLELMPRGLRCRVREVQSHGAALRAARAGQRTALNITGVERDAIDRGDELATPGYLVATRHVDARVRLVARREKPLPTHRRVRVSMGTREEIAMLVCLDGPEIPPGRSGLAQLRFARAVVADYGQRIILRDETAQQTLGGGIVLRPASWRLKVSADEAAGLREMESREARARVGAVLRSAGFDSPRPERLACLAGVEPDEARRLIAECRAAGELVTMGGREVHAGVVAALRARAMDYLARHHARSAQEPGVLQDRFVGWLERRSAPGCGRAIFGQMQAAGDVQVHGPYVARRDFRPALSAEDAALLERLVAELAAVGLDPPEWSALKTVAGLSRQRSGMLLELARSEPRLVQVGPQLYADAGAIGRLKETVRELGRDGRRFRLAEVRDALGLSRRAVLPLLEYLDRTRFTRRVGDERVLIEGGA